MTVRWGEENKTNIVLFFGRVYFPLKINKDEQSANKEIRNVDWPWETKKSKYLQTKKNKKTILI